MYIAMNRFIINPGFESAFEEVWRNRDSKLALVSGFQTFKLLKGPVDDKNNTTLYASHTIWNSYEDFVAWTKSEHFREAHRNAGDNSAMYVGHPNFEGFEVVEGM